MDGWKDGVDGRMDGWIGQIAHWMDRNWMDG
jgi:hypothetical protein